MEVTFVAEPLHFWGVDPKGPTCARRLGVASVLRTYFRPVQFRGSAKETRAQGAGKQTKREESTKEIHKEQKAWRIGTTVKLLFFCFFVF